jgi:DNA-binding transcriptional LysR family regulator
VPDKKRTARLDWEDVRFFVALARFNSLSAAARTLDVNHATVARRVASLEGTLGRSLFDRRANGYALTAEGKAILDAANAMDQAAFSVLRHLDAGTELSGLVRLTTARVLADGFLIDRLGALHECYPALDLELIAESRIVSLSKREADIALRLGRPRDSELIARRAARVAFGFYASAGYRDKLDAGHAPVFIGYDEDSDFVAEAAWLARLLRDQRFAFRSNSQTSQAAAARAGYGVALLPLYLAANDPGLVPISMGEPPPARDVWLLIRPDLAKIPRVRAVADYLIELFRRERPLLSGSQSEAHT